MSILWAVFIVVTTGLVTHWCHRLVGRRQLIERENRNISLMATALGFAVAEEYLEDEEAQRVFRFWWTIYNQVITPVECACGVLALHCDKDEAVHMGILHTAKFCDVVPDGYDSSNQH